MTSNQQRTFLPLVLFLTIFIRTNAQVNFNENQTETSPEENSTATMISTESNMTNTMSTSASATSTTLTAILMNGSAFQPQGPSVPPTGQFPFPQSGHFPPPNAQFPNGQFPNGQFPNGQFPNGQFPNGQFPNGQFPNNQFPNGQFPNGQFPPPPPHFGQPGMMPSQEGLPGGGINHPAMAGQPGMQGPGGDHQGSIPNDPSLPRFFDVPNNSTAHADDVDKTKYDIHKNNQPGVQGDDPSMTKPEPTVGSSREINPQKVTDRPRGAATCVTITNHLLIASISFAFFHRIKNSIF